MPATAEPLADMALPEHLRLPDLSDVRTFTAADVAGWIAAAQAAFAWGPSVRNGCRRARVGEGTFSQWFDADMKPHSPDPWTPSTIAHPSTYLGNPHPGFAIWHCHGRSHRDGDQPIEISRNLLDWHPAARPMPGGLHRAPGPLRIHRQTGPEWLWHGCRADDLAPLLTRAWTATTLTDADVADLLDQAAALPDRASTSASITAQGWLAHVLAANPHLSAAAHAWIALLLT